MNQSETWADSSRVDNSENETDESGQTNETHFHHDLCWHQVLNCQIQEAQLPQRNSASAAHMEGGWG